MNGPDPVVRLLEPDRLIDHRICEVQQLVTAKAVANAARAHLIDGLAAELGRWTASGLRRTFRMPLIETDEPASRVCHP